MGTILDRLVLALCCITAMLAGEINIACVTGGLFAITISSIMVYSEKGAVKTALLAVCAVSCLVWPEFIWMLPLAGYESCFHNKTKWQVIYLILVLFSREYIAVRVLLLCLACFLAKKTRFLLEKEREYQDIQDAYLELKAGTERRQSELAMRQDGEIHLATLAERNRIAREIHDNVGHMLSRAILQVGALKAVNRQENLGVPLDALGDTLNTAMDNIRDSVHDLKDEAFDLEDALDRIISEYPGFTVRLDYDMGNQVSRNLKYCFAAIVREALTNTAKHSNADKVRIVIREHPALYQLMVEDNGTDQKAADLEGMGLENMKERADAFGGTFYTSREKGFRIFLSIPKTNRNGK